MMNAGELLNEGNQLKRSGKLDEAISLYREALEVYPDFAWTYYELGDALAEVGRIEEAMISYRRSFELSQKSPTSQTALNQCSGFQAESGKGAFNKTGNMNGDEIFNQFLMQQLENNRAEDASKLQNPENPHHDKLQTEFCPFNSSGYKRYINLIKSCLRDDIYGSDVSIHSHQKTRAGKKATPSELEDGSYWPSRAHTMIGRKRLDNLQFCIESVLRNRVEGDLIETGVWRGGATILMKAILEILNVQDRKIFVADSFEGLPQPDPDKYPADRGDRHFTVDYLKVGLHEVQNNFRKYDLLDGQVIFIKGFFEDSLQEEELNKAGLDKIAVLRLDGDMYSSTIQVLNSLYDKVAVGGYIIVDDYGAVPGCRAAVDDFRRSMNISEEMIEIDWTGVYWQKCSHG